MESVTVAVQLVEAPAAKAGGLQLTVVTVGCLVTVTAAAVALEELSWVASPWFVEAEVGIREVAVTGVQTCALPISVPVSEQLVKAVVEPSAKKLTVPVAKGG